MSEYDGEAIFGAQRVRVSQSVELGNGVVSRNAPRGKNASQSLSQNECVVSHNVTVYKLLFLAKYLAIVVRCALSVNEMSHPTD